jgi:hypothetical protein
MQCAPLTRAVVRCRPRITPAIQGYLYGSCRRASSGNFATLAAIRRASSAGEQLGCRSSPRLVLEVDVGELLAIVIAHHEAGGLFLDDPRRPGSGELHASPRIIALLPYPPLRARRGIAARFA